MAAHAEEVRVDPSSDPGRDDYGLPPVDIEIPDDARDLDRDVQAYHRELRARAAAHAGPADAGRWPGTAWSYRWSPGCLALTLLSGTLLTVLANRQVSPRPAGRRRARPSGPRPRRAGNIKIGAVGTGPASPASGLLPNARCTLLDGKHVGLRSLVPAVLAWVPTGCGCGAGAAGSWRGRPPRRTSGSISSAPAGPRRADRAGPASGPGTARWWTTPPTRSATPTGLRGDRHPARTATDVRYDVVRRLASTGAAADRGPAAGARCLGRQPSASGSPALPGMPAPRAPDRGAAGRPPGRPGRPLRCASFRFSRRHGIRGEHP